MWALNPVACEISSAGPRPPRSWTATETPSLDSTRRIVNRPVSARCDELRARRHQLLNSRSQHHAEHERHRQSSPGAGVELEEQEVDLVTLAVLEHEDDGEGDDRDERDQLDRRTARTTTCRGVVVDRHVHDPYLPITVSLTLLLMGLCC